MNSVTLVSSSNLQQINSQNQVSQQGSTSTDTRLQKLQHQQLIQGYVFRKKLHETIEKT